MTHRKAIGVFGSSFDPIHLGHLRLVQKVQQVMKFDEIRMVLTGRPPHKPYSTISREDRWLMLCLACESLDYLVPEDFEKDRTELSYSIDTIEYLVGRDRAASFCWIMGSDAYYGLSSWHRWTELFDLCNFVVVNRPMKEELIGDHMSEFFNRRMVKQIDAAKNGQILNLRLPMIEISSSEIRRLIKKQGRFFEFVPRSVADHIASRRLYR
tara:strand:- start:126 stop:758 length:633 start_codon:yes stop_codon:yes gene_type:complete